MGENTRVLTGDPKRPPGEVNPLAAACLRVIAPAVDMEIVMTQRR
jgi:hypothetical protein